ncbi:hypothetical protein [Desulfosporosinus shakirovi]
MAAARRIKEDGLNNDLVERIINDDSFKMSKQEILDIINPIKFIGRAPSQVVEFIAEYVNPILEANRDALGVETSINV